MMVFKSDKQASKPPVKRRRFGFYRTYSTGEKGLLWSQLSTHDDEKYKLKSIARKSAAGFSVRQILMLEVDGFLYCEEQKVTLWFICASQLKRLT